MSGRRTIRTVPWLVVTDLDGTLLGDPEATKRFLHWWSTWDQNRRLVYASGRQFESVLASFHESGLPEPNAIISNVGTDVRLLPAGSLLSEWPRSWWPGWNLELVRLALDPEPEFELQPPECQSEYKRSYFVRNASPGVLDHARQLLRKQPVAADVIYSSNRDLDVVPSGANKGTAAAFLANLWGIPRSSVLAAGDSGNDLSLFYQGFRGIVVGNAQPELARLNRIDVHKSVQHYADGVIEGLNFWLHRAPVIEREASITSVAESLEERHSS